MNTMVEDQGIDTARRSGGGSSPRRRVAVTARPRQRLAAAGFVGGLLPGMILGLVVGLLTGSFVIAAIVGVVAIVAGGVIGARLADNDAVDTDNPVIF